MRKSTGETETQLYHSSLFCRLDFAQKILTAPAFIKLLSLQIYAVGKLQLFQLIVKDII